MRLKELGLVLSIVSMISCDAFKNNPKTSETKVKGKFIHYTNEKLKFSIDFPKKWVIETNPKPKKAVKNFLTMAYNAESPLENKNDAYQENIGVAVIDTLLLKAYLAPTDPSEEQISDEKAKEEKEKMLKAKTDATKVESNGTLSSPAGTVYWSVSKAYPSEDGKVTLKQMAYNLRKGVKQYKVGWVGEANKVEMYRPIVERIVRSITFE